MKHWSTKNGFTIVELLIVIVVIGILAAITVVAYTGMQNRARDSQRQNDMQSIIKALAIYKAQVGSYPTPSYNGPGGWESSSINPSQFLTPLKTSGVVSTVGVDPVNTTNVEYRYYVYPAGYTGCDSAKGNFYVLGVLDMQTTGRPDPKSPGWSCSGRDWQAEFDWVTGSFENQ